MTKRTEAEEETKSEKSANRKNHAERRDNVPSFESCISAAAKAKFSSIDEETKISFNDEDENNNNGE